MYGMNLTFRVLRTLFVFALLSASFAQTAYEALLQENPVVLRAGMYEEQFEELDWRFNVVIAGVVSMQGMAYTPELKSQFVELFPAYLAQRAEELALVNAAKARGIEVDVGVINELIDGLTSTATEDYPVERMLADNGLSSLDQLRTLAVESNYIDQLITQLIDTTEIDDASVALHYSNNKNQYHVAPNYCARHILVEDEELAQFIIDEVNNNGVSFADLAAEHGTDGTASRGGDLGCFGPGQMIPEFEAAIIEAPIGEAAGPVASQFGYHAIFVEFAHHGGVAPLEQIADQIRDELMNARLGNALDSIYKFSGVVTYPEALETLAQ